MSSSLSFWTAGRPALADGRLFVADGYNVLALDAATGAILWTHRVRVAPAAVTAALTVRNGRVVISEVDSIMAMDAVDGHTVWNIHPETSAEQAVPATDETTFYAGQRTTPYVTAIELSSGKARWKVNVGAGYAFPANIKGVTVVGDTVYAVLDRQLQPNPFYTGGALVALDRATGRELWRTETAPSEQHRYLEPAAVVGRYIIVADAEATSLFALDMVTHQQVWRAPFDGNIAIFTLNGVGTFFAGGQAGDVIALDPNTGVRRWQKHVGSAVGGLALCNGTLLVSDGLVRALDAATGSLISQAGAGGGEVYSSSLVTDGKRAYVTGSTGVTALECP